MSYLFGIITIVCFLYSLYILLLFLALLFSKEEKNRSMDQRASIVVPFRNEKGRLERLLDSFEEMEYPKDQFEVLLINDHSSDGSENIELTEFTFHIRIIDSSKPGKKSALTEGINNASYGLIVQTDADCAVPKHWLSAMLGELRKQDLVCGSVLFSNSWIQNLELLSYLGIGKATSNLGSPILANGANMAYRKSDFVELGGFEANRSTSSGDDIFLLRGFAKAGKSIGYCLSPDTCVTTKAENSLSAFFKQRIRWAGKTSKSKHAGTIFAGVLLVLTNVAVLIQIGKWSLIGFDLQWGSISVFSKISVDVLFLFLMALKVRVYKPLFCLPVAIALYSLYIVLVAILGVFYRPEWKNRKIQI